MVRTQATVSTAPSPGVGGGLAGGDHSSQPPALALLCHIIYSPLHPHDIVTVI